MDIAQLTETLQRDAAEVVFINVLLQQMGLPVPAVPTLLVAGSLIAPERMPALLVAAVVASVLADAAWYAAGRIFGYRILAGLCLLSINPASCVNQTEARFLRWGLASLVIAKFVPGFSTVAPPIAGSLRMSITGFLLAAATGAALWAGFAVAAGWLLRSEVLYLITFLDRHVGSATAVLAAAAAAWIGWKLWQKHRFNRLADLPHIEPAELALALAGDQPPLLLDLRGSPMIAQLGAVAGAAAVDMDQLLDAEAVRAYPRDRLIVTFCACPQDAGAVYAARRLRRHGYADARPLRGGYDAWISYLQRPAGQRDRPAS